MAEVVKGILGAEKAMLWWKTANPMLGNIEPWKFCLTDQGETKLFNFIMDAAENNGALT